MYSKKFMWSSATFRSSRPEVFVRKVVLEIRRKFTGEHPYRSVISVKLQSNFIEIAFRYGCSPVNLLHIFRTPFPKNTSEGLLLVFHAFISFKNNIWYLIKKLTVINKGLFKVFFNPPLLEASSHFSSPWKWGYRI